MEEREGGGGGEMEAGRGENMEGNSHLKNISFVARMQVGSTGTNLRDRSRLLVIHALHYPECHTAGELVHLPEEGLDEGGLACPNLTHHCYQLPRLDV